MSVYHPIIRFKDKTNYDYELVVSHFDADLGEFDSYQNMEPIYSDNHDGSLRNDFGAKYTSVATPVVTFTDPSSGNISPYKIRSVLRWLTGSKDVSFMDICDENGTSVCAYIGRFTDVKLHKMDAITIGIVAYFTSISPFAYSDIKEVKFSVTDAENGTSFSIDNDTDDIYNPLYPSIVFNNQQPEDSSNPDKVMFSLKNNTMKNETTFKHLKTNEVITIDSNFVVYSDSDTGRIFNDDFNFDFPILAPGTNDFNAVGNGELLIRFRYPMKLADGLLNDYDVSGDLIVFVEDAVMRLKGDVNRNPPNGTSIKVNGATLVVRGSMKSVRLPGFSEVEKEGKLYNLLVDYGNVDCPFDGIRARVVDGELIIGGAIDSVKPDYNFTGRNNN